MTSCARCLRCGRPLSSFRRGRGTPWRRRCWMVGSVIHSAVTAACLWGLPGLKTHLVAFDTNVVDLTSDVTDPVELLMKVQLGGGTDIARAVDYAPRLLQQPKRALRPPITGLY